MRETLRKLSKFSRTVIRKILRWMKAIRTGIRKKLRLKKANRLADRQLKRNQPIKLHVGSGKLVIDDSWINIDLESEPNVDISMNVLEGLPFAGDSVDFVYSEHFIEHLPKHGAKRFLTDVFRILKPGGVHRILTPDLRGCVDVFLSGTWPEIDWTRKHKIETSADYLNHTMRLWGHQFLFDKETLFKFAEEAGYAEMTWEKLNESRFIDLQNIDTRPKSIILDAVKPKNS